MSGSTLELLEVSPQDEGLYQCVLDTGGGGPPLRTVHKIRHLHLYLTCFQMRVTIEHVGQASKQPVISMSKIMTT